ncbi:MAG: YfgM family protein [Gammaproteobacteria bacterium WSBS_2016_MAG_OTU1]
MSDLNEELLERVQALWHSYKFHLIIVLLMIFSAIAGLLYKSAVRSTSHQIAGTSFYTIVNAVEEGDVEAASAALDGIDGEEFPEMRNLALVALATAHNTDGNAESAIARLREAEEQETDEGLRQALVLRLAELLINDGQTDEALAVLDDPEVEEDSAMNLLFAERRGDAYYAAGKLTEARVEYLRAREDALTSFRSYMPVLNIKIGAVSSLATNRQSEGEPNQQLDNGDAESDETNESGEGDSDNNDSEGAADSSATEETQ